MQIIKIPDGTMVTLTRTGDRGGQHVGTPPLMVTLTNQRSGRSLVLVSGIKSDHRVRVAVETCSHWSEVPLAVEADVWR